MSAKRDYIAVHSHEKLEQMDTVTLDDEDDFLGGARNTLKKRNLEDRLRQVVFGLQWTYLLLSLRFLIASWITYSLLGRYFVMLPFAFESLLAVCCASIFFFKFENVSCWRTSIYYGWLITDSIINIYLLVFIFDVKSELVTEPSGVLNSDWKWLNNFISFYAVCSAFSILISIALIILSIIYFKFKDCYCIRSCSCKSCFHQSKKSLRSKFKKTISELKDDRKYLLRASFYILLLLVNILTFSLATFSLLNLFAYKSCNGKHCNDYCDETDPTMCILPFPSTFFLKEDSTTPTGYRVNFGEKSLPSTKDRSRIHPKYLNEMDGFSTIGPMLFYLDDATLDGVVTHENISLYLDGEVKTIIIDASTRLRVPHFVEIDAVDKSKPLIIIQPVVPLEFNTRYIVGIRRFKNSKGEIIQPSEAFQKLTPEQTTGDARWEYFHQRVFPLLTNEGFIRDDLQLAWDFITTSREWCLGRAEWMRDDALNRIKDSETYGFEIYQIEEKECTADSPTARIVWGKATVPSYKESKSRFSLLTRDGDGPRGIRFNGVMETEFVVQIPCSVYNSPKSSLTLQYGHGLLGDRSEGISGWMRKMSDELGYVVFSTDWYGMSSFDVLVLVKILLSDPSHFAVLTENSIQGFVNSAVVLEMLKTRIMKEDSLKVNGISVIDPNRIYYYGNSQGAILGGAYVALSKEFKRAIMGVPGTPYALLLSRSVDFEVYHALFNLEMLSWRDIRLTLGLMQMLWDPAETAGWLYSMKRSPGPGNHPKEILIHDALGDAQVTNLGAHIMARSYNANTVYPQTRPIFGISERQGPFNGSAIVEFKYDDVPPEPFENIAPNRDTDTHECPRRQIEAHNQIRDFLETGVIKNYCNGACERPTCSDLH